LKLSYPTVSEDKRKELAAAEAELKKEDVDSLERP
jgi:hypothetical protein